MEKHDKYKETIIKKLNAHLKNSRFISLTTWTLNIYIMFKWSRSETKLCKTSLKRYKNMTSVVPVSAQSLWSEASGDPMTRVFIGWWVSVWSSAPPVCDSRPVCLELYYKSESRRVTGSIPLFITSFQPTRSSVNVCQTENITTRDNLKSKCKLWCSET